MRLLKPKPGVHSCPGRVTSCLIPAVRTHNCSTHSPASEGDSVQQCEWTCPLHLWTGDAKLAVTPTGLGNDASISDAGYHRAGSFPFEHKQGLVSCCVGGLQHPDHHFTLMYPSSRGNRVNSLRSLEHGL